MLKGAAGLAAAGLVPWSASGLARPSGTGPNIIYIMADDLGFADLSCYGRRDFSTPNIDRLANEGMLFRQAYANSAVCSATRIALITGRYQYRLVAGLDEPMGFTDVGLPPDLPTMPRQLQAAGYHTVLIGKWHMGGPPSYGPLKSGYERFFGIYGGGTDYFRHNVPAEGVPHELSGLIDQDELDLRDGYVTEIFGTEAIKAIEEAPAGRPFFMSLHFTAPHWPWEGPDDREVSEDLSQMMHFDGGSLETYSAMVRSMDGEIGKLLDYLDRSGLAENTIVVFTSDNGGERFSDTWPLIGVKTELLEGGIRVPFLVRWPGRVAPGTVTQQTAMSMDALPTLLAAAGREPDPAFPPDGMNLLPVLDGGAAQSRTLFWRYKAMEQAAIRDGDWKYLLIGGEEYLFNLAEDERERANLKRREPERFAQLKERFAEWNSEMLPYSLLNSSWNVKQGKEGWADRY